MENTIVMYHYVRNKSNFKCMTTEQFRQQVDYLSGKYKIITLAELIGKKNPEKTCILTFDDGIKDCYANVLPILEERNIKASFFAPTSILDGKKILGAQKRHLLLAKIGTEKLVEEFNSLAEDYMQVNESDNILASYCNYKPVVMEDALTRNLKYILDHIDPEISEKIIGKIFSRYFDEKKEFEKIYLSRKDLKEMQNKGMEIGVHGHYHRWLGKLYLSDQLYEFKKAIGIYEKVFKEPPKYASYPFGSYNFFTLRLMQKFNIEAGLTTVKRVNTDLNGPYELGRFDCVDMPYKGA